MTGFDFAVAGILLISLAFGLWHGLVYEALSLLGWPIAFVVCKLFGDGVVWLLPIADWQARVLVGYALVFFAALLVWGVLASMFSRLVKAVGLGLLDIVLGGMFGLVRGVLVVLVLVWLAGLTQIPDMPFWRNAQLRRTAEDAALLTKVWLPDSLGQRIHYGTRR